MVAVGAMLSIDISITIVALLPILTTVVLSHLASPKVAEVRRRSREAHGEVTNFIGEIFGSVQSVKLSNAESPVLCQFDKLGTVRSKTAITDSFTAAILNACNGIAVGLSTGGVLLFAGPSASSGEVSMGDLVLFLYFAGFITEWAQLIGSSILTFRQADVSFQRMLKLIPGAQLKDLVGPRQLFINGSGRGRPFYCVPAKDPLELLKVRGLTFKYPRSNKGIQNVNLDLLGGSLTVIAGRVGSGKSTIIRALLGLVPQQRGEVYWNGKIVSDRGSFFVPPRSSYTPQHIHLFSGTLRENIALGFSDDDRSIERAIRLAVLDEDVKTLEEGIDTIIGQRGLKLSGGQKQRVAIARMLISRSEFLVLDDPTSSLDMTTENEFWKRLCDWESSSILAASNSAVALKKSDQVIVMKDGEVHAVGKSMSLLTSCAELQQIWNGDLG